MQSRAQKRGFQPKLSDKSNKYFLSKASVILLGQNIILHVTNNTQSFSACRERWLVSELGDN